MQMRIYRFRVLLTRVVFILLFLCFCVHGRAQGHEVSQKYQRKNLNAVVVAAVRYYLGDHNDAYRGRLVCYLSDDEGGKDPIIVQKLKRMGIKVGDGTETVPAKMLKPFDYLSLGKIEWLTSRRVKISVSANYYLDPPIYTEAYGTLYLNYVRHKWVVDEKDSIMETGD